MGVFSIHLKHNRAFHVAAAPMPTGPWDGRSPHESLLLPPPRVWQPWKVFLAEIVLFVRSQSWGTSITICQPPKSPPPKPGPFGHRGSL